jgi:hypothetical protein
MRGMVGVPLAGTLGAGAGHGGCISRPRRERANGLTGSVNI